jgi:hypothetical protein
MLLRQELYAAHNGGYFVLLARRSCRAAERLSEIAARCLRDTSACAPLSAARYAHPLGTWLAHVQSGADRAHRRHTPAASSTANPRAACACRRTGHRAPKPGRVGRRGQPWWAPWYPYATAAGSGRLATLPRAVPRPFGRPAPRRRRASAAPASPALSGPAGRARAARRPGGTAGRTAAGRTRPSAAGPWYPGPSAG